MIRTRVGRHTGYLFYEFYRRRIALAENRVTTIQMRSRHLSDEKLRAITVRVPLIRIGQTPWPIKEQVRGHFVSEGWNRIVA